MFIFPCHHLGYDSNEIPKALIDHKVRSNAPNDEEKSVSFRPLTSENCFRRFCRNEAQQHDEKNTLDITHSDRRILRKNGKYLHAV